MALEVKDFGGEQGSGDYDSAPHKVKPHSWVNLENMRVLTTDAGEVGNVESIGSNVLINNPNLPAGTNVIIGNAVDAIKTRIIFFVWNSLGNHAIFCYDINAEIIYICFFNSQVITGFNFDKDHLIHTARVENNCVYWSDDGLNEPRRFNIDAAIKMNQPSYVTSFAPYSNPVDEAVISWARRPPALPWTPTKKWNQAILTNFIANEAFTFCSYYQFRDYEISVLGFQSTLANYNNVTDVVNYVNLQLPFPEQIDQDVIRVFLVARYLNSGVFFVIRTWDTSIPADAAAIAAHNAGATQLSYDFYNNATGIALDPTFAVKPFDSIPITCRGFEIAKNRSFMANDLMGYTSPLTTSLILALVNGNTTQVTGRWYLFRFQNVYQGITTVMTVYLLDISNLPIGYPLGYYVATTGSFPPVPSTIDWSILVFHGVDLFTVMSSYFTLGVNNILQFTSQGVTAVVTNAPVGPGSVGQNVFKSDSFYQAAITFYDNYQRKCGVVTNDTLLTRMPDRTFADFNSLIYIDWSLDNTNAALEIMQGAYYYSIDITLCLRTRFFQQAQSRSLVTGQQPVNYVTKDTSGNYVFTTVAYDPQAVGIAIDISCLNTFSQGYVFSQGDLVKLYISNQPASIYTLIITGQSGQYIICQLQNIGNLNNTLGYLFEIYTPYVREATEPYYEVAQVFPIVNPGTSNPSYSVTNGVISGDVTILKRTNAAGDYYVESMSPNDKVYKMWNTNAGRPNFIDKIGQQLLTNSISFSNTLISGAQTNGLSTFDALDTQDVYLDCAPIRKLQLTSKVANELGTVMLAICEKETASLYLGEAQLLASAADADITQSTSVIGTINVLKGSFGTRRPESVVEFRGNVFFQSDPNGKVVQYSDSGLFPISNYKMTVYWKLFWDLYNSLTLAQIEALGSRPFVFGGVDPHNWELLFSVPTLSLISPHGYLPDYPEMIYPFNIWDAQAKTIVYKLSADPNFWQGAFNKTAEGWAYINNLLFSFKSGNIYQENDTETCGNFYGTQYQSRIMFCLNQIPNKPKLYENIVTDANMRPTLTYFRTEPTLVPTEQYDLWEQASDLADFSYKVKEGELYAVILRNKLIPTQSGYLTTGLLTAEKMRALVLKCMVVFSPTTTPTELRYITVGYDQSRGHNVD